MALVITASSVLAPGASGKTFMASSWAAGAAPWKRTFPSSSWAQPRARAATWVPWLSDWARDTSPSPSA